MRPFTPQEILEAIPKLSREASLELTNLIMVARLDALEGEHSDGPPAPATLGQPED